MTCREKLQIEHPECVNEIFDGGCRDCPTNYGYCTDGKCDCKTVNDDICKLCWDQEYEGEVTALEIGLLQYSNLRNNINRVKNEVLGEDYWNVGMDVYTCDKFMCDSLIHKYKELKSERNSWKIWFLVTFITWGIFLAVRVFGG